MIALFSSIFLIAVLHYQEYPGGVFMRFFIVSFLVLAGCFQTFNEDDEESLRTVPVTNNPHIIPSHGAGLPMMGGG